MDLLPIAGSPEEAERRSLQRGFQPWATVPFLDAGRSVSWARAFYIPWISPRRVTYAEYALLLSRNGAKALEAAGVAVRLGLAE